MIVGCQRSGTTMMQSVFENDLDADVYGELSRLTSGVGRDRVRLSPLDEVRQVVEASRFPLIVMKPLVESQRIKELLDEFPAAKALWMYRHYDAVVASSLRHFGRQNGIRDLRPIVEGRIDDWRAEEVAEDVRALLQRHFDERMSPDDAAALFWYVRNSHFLRQELDRNPRVLPVEYDTFVHDPVPGLERIYAFLGRPSSGLRNVKVIDERGLGSGAPVRLSPQIDALCREMWDALEAARRRGATDPEGRYG